MSEREITEFIQLKESGASAELIVGYTVKILDWAIAAAQNTPCQTRTEQNAVANVIANIERGKEASKAWLEK